MVKIRKLPTWNQKIIKLRGLKRLPLLGLVEKNGSTRRIKIDKTKKTTPPILLGMERRIA